MTDRRKNSPCFWAVWTLLFALVTLMLPRTLRAQDAALWRETAPEPVDSITMTPLGSALVLAKGGGLTALDSETGSRLWTRDDVVQHALADRMAVAVATLRGGGYAVIDIGSGRDRWASSALPFTKIEQWYLIERDTLLFVGSTPDSDHTVMAVDLKSGDARWRKDDLFRSSPQLAGKARSVRYNDVAEADGSLFLDASYGGLMCLDRDTGELRWRASDPSLKPTKALSSGSVPMLVAGDRLFVATGRSLVVLDAKSGRPVARRRKNFPTAIVQMASTANGLLVRGAYNVQGAMARHAWKSYLAMIDPATGDSRWSTEGRRPALDVRASFVVQNDRVIVALAKGLAEIDLTTGAVRKNVALPAFQDGDGPASVEPLDDGRVLLSSAETTRLVDWTGHVHFDRYYKAPGMGMFAKLGMAAAYGMAGYAVRPLLQPALLAVFSRDRVAADVDRYRYILAEVADKSILVRIERATGAEAGRVSFEERKPTFAVNTSTGVVVIANDRSVVARRFPPVP